MSSAKHFTEVLIGGKVYTLSGFEGEEYLQKVSSYLNHKITECTNSEGYRKQSADTRNVLLALNIADDYFKAKKQGDSLEALRPSRQQGRHLPHPAGRGHAVPG